MFERSSEVLVFGPFRFEPGNGLWRDAEEVPLPPRALAVLAALAERPGQVVSKSDLLDAGWKDAFVTEASLLEAVRVLRDALEDDRLRPTYIQTVHRRGYRFVAPLQSGNLPVDPAAPSTSEHWRPHVVAAAAHPQRRAMSRHSDPVKKGGNSATSVASGRAIGSEGVAAGEGTTAIAPTKR